MTRRRLLMTVDAVGGVWPYALDLAAALGDRGWTTLLAVLGPAPAADQRAAAAAIPHLGVIDSGLPLDWLADDAAAVADAAAAVAALAATHAADVVQFNQPALAGATLPVPSVVAVHSCVATWWDAVRGGPLPPALAWQAALTGRGLAAADAVVAPSAAFAAAVAARYGTTPQVVPNGRSPQPPARAAAQHDFAFTAGRLWDAGKDAATLDRVAARLAVPFKAAGPLAGPNGEAVAPHHLRAVGRLDAAQLAACLAARPVFVSAARYEPFGLAVLEAAQAGCALVLSDIATFRELWDGAATFVAPGDDAGFAAAVTAAIGDHAGRLAAGERARRRAAHYTPAATAAAMDAIYRRLLAAPRRIAA